MSSNSNLEISGSLRHYTPAELFAEVAGAKLNGSLRLANAATAQKTIVYFDAGEAVFAVSNARRFRLFEMLVAENKITEQQITATPDFTNDSALSANLIASGLLSKEDADALAIQQIEEILRDAFAWHIEDGGEWIFSPLVRIKGDVRFAVKAAALLIEHARRMPDAATLSRFKNLSETFAVKHSMPAHVDLRPEEAFVLSRFEQSALRVEQAAMLGGLPMPSALRIIYALWLAGFLARRDWSAPFSTRTLDAIVSANLTLKKPSPAEAKSEAPEIKVAVAENNASFETEKSVPAREELSLEKYLERIETAKNYYDFFAVPVNASVPDIKRGYLSLAKRFHPDLFRRENDEVKLRQVQNAFTRIAQAYETLKNEKSREVYDYKMRKELLNINSGQGELSPESEEREKQLRINQAAEDFENGFNLLMDGETEEALPFFSRAAYLDQNNARYHAYYGKALSADGKQKHKAEAEYQAAIRLAPENADLRLMLAEFFVQMNLPKRAEGELNRLLLISPNHSEAKQMLEGLSKR